MHGGNNGRMRPTGMGRGCGRDVLNTSHLGRHNTHVGGRHHRVLATRYITADAVHRDVAVPQNDARQGLDFEIVEAFLLFLGKVPDLLLGKPDILDVLFRDLVDRGLDLFCREAERWWAPVIEFL